jgi:uncharacterized protein with NAD-binding domain and iron-sulfur cluster
VAGSKQRVAILGGGVAALSAAFALTEVDPKGEKYEITLHQLGWRLGGKTASGRNAEYGQRIEEHGLHIWAGFYENAFTILRCVLKALNRPPTNPIATIGDAFKRQSQIFYAELHDGQWLPWPFWFQPDADENVYPGRDNLWATDPIVPPLSTIVQRMIASIIFNLNYYENEWPGDPRLEAARAIATLSLDQQLRLARISVANRTGHPLLTMAHCVCEDLKSDAEAVRRDAHQDLRALLGSFRTIAKECHDADGLAEELRRALILINLGICMLLGMLDNGCLQDGLEVLDRYEFREFLAQQDEAAANNAIVTALYEYIFAYEGGSRDKPSVSACSAVQGLLRLFFTYKGAFFFKSVVGMGDTICTPIYQLLKQRGVKFKFFHKVTGLEPTADGDNIGTILIDQQVALVDGVDEYYPLVPVNGVDCWPSTPLWAQIKDGYALTGYNFENAYGPPFPPQPPPVARLSLKLGQDFDQVILGISVGALRDICAPLMRDKPAWADMIDNLPTVRTQALQLWINSLVTDLGGPYVQPLVPPKLETMGPIVTTCKPPLDTYSDMSQLLPAEAWPAPAPLSIAYYCAIMGDDQAPDNEALAADSVKLLSREWMTSWLDTLWTHIGQGADFRWDLLHSPGGGVGPARLDEQFWRANINPTERYVLSLPGTLNHRMNPGDTGYANLYVTGDWTRVPEINAGCVEVAAMSGLAAASALSGVYIPIATMSPEPFITNQYVNYAGWNTLPPAPYLCNDTSFYAFGFHADPVSCQDFLDRSYNLVAGRDQFRVMLDVAFLNIVQSRRTSAATPPFSLQGTMAETDIGLWLLVGSYESGAVLPKSIGFVPAYLFIDNGWSAVAGHDVWGYPKYFSTMVQPDTAPSTGPFEVTALAIQKYAPTAQASQQRMLKLDGGGGGLPSQAELAAGLVGLAASPVEIFKKLCAGADPERLRALVENPAMPSFLGAGPGLPFPVFYLKQSRSADSLTAASYKALLKGDLTLTKIHPGQFGLLPGNWTLELGEFDSQPFIRDLGLGTPTDGKLVLTTGIGLWAEIDFTVGMASVIT